MYSDSKVCKSFTLDREVYKRLYMLKTERNVNLSSYVNRILKEALQNGYADILSGREI